MSAEWPVDRLVRVATGGPARTRRLPLGSLASGESQARLGTWKRSVQPGWIDRKRAAANDIDD